MVSVVLFIAAMLLFMGLFNQTIQTATVYQQHSALATKTSDLLDNMLLSSGTPVDWGKRRINSTSPTGFGLHDEALAQYQLSPFSLMRLESSAGKPVNYEVGGQTTTYNNVTMNSGEYLLVPHSEVLNYSYASKLLGTNGSYGFSLTLAPTVHVSISIVESLPTLTFSVNVTGTGLPLANSRVIYYLITVSGRDAPNSPVYNIYSGASSTDAGGMVTVSRDDVDVTQKSYALIVSASVSGLSGVGYYSNSLHNSSYVVPLVSNFETGTVNLAHSYGILDDAGQNVTGSESLYYNVTFLPVSDMTRMSLNNGTGGSWVCGNLDASHRVDSVNLDTRNLGVLVVAYSTGASTSGVVVMPWGFSPLGFSVTFGGQPGQQEWVSTDLRQVLVNNIPYQAKLMFWSNEGHKVIT
jgi:Tfp pilus assembly protein PilV